jgi:glycosyltransferase involved in cell wall biosynthesis
VTAEKLSHRDGSFRLSVIVPTFNEEATVKGLLERVVATVQHISPEYEVVVVNDGSTDSTLAMLMIAHLSNPHIKIVNLSRNFGKEAALTAGLNYAIGDIVIPIDADLQHPPELIPRMVAEWRKGYDMVVAVRADRAGDSAAKRVAAALFYRVMRRLSDVPLPAHAGDFRLIDRRVVEALKLLPERTRFMKGLFAWVGFRQASIAFDPPPRLVGRSRWGYVKLWNFALDGLFSSTTLPLRIWTYLGLGLALAALAYMLVIILRTLIHGVDVPGYASLAAMLLFFSGMNMIGLGILGEYVGRLFVEAKQRPQYLVRDVIGFEPDDKSISVLVEGTAAAGQMRTRRRGEENQLCV